MDAELSRHLARCRHEVLAAARHELSFRTRKEMLLALGPQILNESGHGIDLGPGKFRRTSLAVSVVERVLRLWQQDFSLDDPVCLIAGMKDYLRGEGSLESIRDDAYEFSGEFDHAPGDKVSAWLAGQAAVAGAFVAVRDELLIPTSDVREHDVYDPDDPELWDCAFWAAGAEAGGMPWTDTFDAAKYREFWLWYLDDAVPRAWESAPSS